MSVPLTLCLSLCLPCHHSLVKLWSARNGLLLNTFRGHDSPVNDIAVRCAKLSLGRAQHIYLSPPSTFSLSSPDNTLLASVADSERPAIRVVEMATGEPVATLLGHTKTVNYVKVKQPPSPPHSNPPP